MSDPTGVLRLDRTVGAKGLNAVVKVMIFAVFFVAIFFPPEALEGKAMGFRAPLFLAPAIVIPIVARVRRWDPYPHMADALLTLPFLLDTLGNLFGFYDKWPVTDDILHALNWVPLVAAFHAFRFRSIFDRREAIFLGYGVGAIAIVWWELLEWAVSVDGFGGAGGLALTYGDTIGDLLLSSSGGFIGSWLAVRFLGPTAKFAAASALSSGQTLQQQAPKRLSRRTPPEKATIAPHDGSSALPEQR